MYNFGAVLLVCAVLDCARPGQDQSVCVQLCTRYNIHGFIIFFSFCLWLELYEYMQVFILKYSVCLVLFATTSFEASTYTRGCSTYTVHKPCSVRDFLHVSMQNVINTIYFIASKTIIYV
jgi:hypothetical protein